MKEPGPLKRKLDALYAGPPEDFVAGRNELAKMLKADGDADLATEVKALRRSSVAAALLNRVALGHPKELKAFAAAVSKLRKASAKAKGGALKDAARAERDSAAAIVALAEEEGGEGAALDRVAETLQAAAADEEIEDLLIRGRLEKEQRAASIGFGLDVSDEGDEGVPEPAGGGKGGKGGRKNEQGPSAAKSKRERQAERKREQARRRERKKVEDAKRALHAAVHEEQKAVGETETAEQDLDEAKVRLTQAKERARAAAEAVKEAERQLRGRERELSDLD